MNKSSLDQKNPLGTHRAAYSPTNLQKKSHSAIQRGGIIMAFSFKIPQTNWRRCLCILCIFYTFAKNDVMNTITITKKRKNIDLTEDTLRRLSILAAAQGRSLKAYIENLLTAKANSVEITVSENPSPSGDTWFDNQENMRQVQESVEQAQNGELKTYTIDDIKSALGL